MKYFEKEREPQQFTDWKLNDKMYQRGNPKWNRLPGSIKEILRECICKEQGYICCYCERKLKPGDLHLEHFEPRKHYPLRQLEYDNIYCSCQLEIGEGAPRHCGNSKGSWFNKELLVSPLDSTCESKFKYTHDGQILPVCENDNQSVETINRLQLNIDKLQNLRKAAIEPFLDEELSQEDLELFVQEYLVEKDNNGGHYNEFYTTIKYLFGD
jgi:uncharacterized protein (TIGR02646 family)